MLDKGMSEAHGVAREELYLKERFTTCQITLQDRIGEETVVDKRTCHDWTAES